MLVKLLGESYVARLLVILIIAFALGCGKGPSASSEAKSIAAANLPSQRAKTDAFFVKWFEAHGHTDMVVEEDGVGVGDNATRLKADLYDSKRHDDGRYVIELDFRIRLPANGEITEFVAGMGKSEDQAIDDALLSFMLTTFHVVYKGFVNASDPHMKLTPLEINGATRDVIMGDIMMRGESSSDKIDLHAIRTEIQGVLKHQPLTPSPHWIKIVYAQHKAKPVTVSVMLDNNEHRELTEAVTNLHWPHIEGFYMAKEFIVVK
jgi:hypothetical protein